MTITLVAAVGANGVIGVSGRLPWRLPEDQAAFKALTLGSVLLMGRATYESIGRPLPGRSTVVLTRQTDWSAPGVDVAHDLDTALRLAGRHGDEVFVVGGARVYADTLPLADRLVITHVESAPVGDTFFPDVEWSAWSETSRVPYVGFSIVTYERVRNSDPDESAQAVPATEVTER
jgi:dihydrofolate reductase